MWKRRGGRGAGGRKEQGEWLAEVVWMWDEVGRNAVAEIGREMTGGGGVRSV